MIVAVYSRQEVGMFFTLGHSDIDDVTCKWYVNILSKMSAFDKPRNYIGEPGMKTQWHSFS